MRLLESQLSVILKARNQTLDGNGRSCCDKLVSDAQEIYDNYCNYSSKKYDMFEECSDKLYELAMKACDELEKHERAMERVRVERARREEDLRLHPWKGESCSSCRYFKQKIYFDRDWDYRCTLKNHWWPASQTFHTGSACQDYKSFLA